jgi:hypothetical protein
MPQLPTIAYVHLLEIIYALAKDAKVSVSPPSPTEFSIGHIVNSKQEVDAVMQQAERAGAHMPVDPPDRESSN